MAFTATKKKTSKATKLKSKPSTPKRKPATATPELILGQEEMEQIKSLVSDLATIKERHSDCVLEYRRVTLELELAGITLEQKKSEVTRIADYVKEMEQHFNKVNERKNVVLTDICEKRGIQPQELEYNPATGEVVNLLGN